MTVRLTLLCASTWDATRDAVFGEGALNELALLEAGAARAVLPPYSPAVRAPSVRCAQIAEALGLETAVEPALRDLDHGDWGGRTVAEVVADDPYGFHAWLTDPDAAPHGGESVRALCRRTANWLRSMEPGTGHALVIAGQTAVRALLLQALGVPARAFWHLDVPALSTVSLTPSSDCGTTRLDRGLYGLHYVRDGHPVTDAIARAS
ncbi:histidine phosphatase family protein [Streptomyces sp. PSKA54]|uniref:Histidine phosphatase family protein n=1 Tax=Streptomyces himalayensis subsp. aureolus TaxID=2758039 RepID=A0A7W2HFI7_9ACTN|nr:histidine phosphatase family protein [Streptomyces himalayensis]MBA4861930.1 histidine phosphatase family protein [Streptomyces himalayensis subsp. aureolus]